MIKSYKDVKLGDKLWACNYNCFYNRIEKNLNQTPVYGEIVKGKYGLAFAILKKDGTPRKSGLVYIGSRKYADSEKECIDLYNQLIQDRIDFLEKEILKLRENMIKTTIKKL